MGGPIGQLEAPVQWTGDIGELEGPDPTLEKKQYHDLRLADIQLVELVAQYCYNIYVEALIDQLLEGYER